MESRKSKLNIILAVWWALTLLLLIFGFVLPLMRIPVMGLVDFHEVRGGSRLASWFVMVCFAAGGMAIFLKSGIFRISGFICAIASLAILASCLIRLYLYLSEKLSMLSTEGMDLSRVLQKGGICLMSAFILGVFWLVFYGFATRRKTQ